MPDDRLRLEEQFDIVTAAERATTPLRVLKQGDTFAVFDTHGDVVPATASEHGLYYDGTRFLSRFELLLGRGRPLLLSSTISDDNVVFTADLTNPDRSGTDVSSCRAGDPPLSHAHALGRRLARVHAGVELRARSRSSAARLSVRCRLRRHLRGAGDPA